MRRQSVQVMVILLSSAALLVAVFVFMGGDKRDLTTWEVALQRYLAYKAKATGVTLLQEAAMEAGVPTAFDPTLSRASFSDSLYYHTDFTYDGERGTRVSLRPLPYPPEQVWCVLLKQGTSDYAEGGYGVRFVALHRDIYMAAWVVHEGAFSPGDPDFVEAMQRIGCDFDLVVRGGDALRVPGKTTTVSRR